MTEITSRTWKLDTFVRLDGGIDVLERRSMFAPTDELKPAHDDLHVLLRHRPPSIPGGVLHELRSLWQAMTEGLSR